MALSPGTLAGPYRIEAPLGAGAMGEVYRARDTRLQRDVAVKLLLPEVANDPERRRRFEQEARTIATLNHANLLAIYDVGELEGQPFLVTELLQGQSLRQMLSGGALPVRKAADLGAQIAGGLAAAHAHGIVHRDLKPENIFITADEKAKILDFGLAKANPLATSAVSDEAETLAGVPTTTQPGMVLGTIGYMAPEQARGEAADARSDIFSLGAVLYEMVSGRRAFGGSSGIEVLSAIVRDDPAPLTATGRDLPPVLTGIIQRCLEKNPALRFQSAQDLAFALQFLGATSTGSTLAALPALTPSPRRPTGGVPLWTLAAAAVVAAALAWFFTRGAGTPPEPPEYAQITFQTGTVRSARFEPGGAGIVYSADWSSDSSDAMQVYERRSGDAQPRAVGVKGILAGVSHQDKLAVIQNCKNAFLTCAGTLVVASLTGGGVRERANDVAYAAWAPDGRYLAAVEISGGTAELQYPLGHVLLSTHGWYASPRFSPDGHWIAFLAHPSIESGGGNVEIVPASGGATRVLAAGFRSLSGLAWSADGRRVFVGATLASGLPHAIYSISLGGDKRIVARVPGFIKLADAGPGGTALVIRVEDRDELMARVAGSSKEVNLSWEGANFIGDLSADGKTIVFCQCGQSGGPEGTIFLRPTDGSPPVELGHGIPEALSSDGRFLAARTSNSSDASLELLPTGAGNADVLPRGSIYSYGFTNNFLPDGKALAGLAQPAANAPWRIYVQDISGAPPRFVSPPVRSTGTAPVTADGRYALAQSAADGRWYLYPLAGGTPRLFTKVPPLYLPLRFASDGKRLFAADVAKFPYTTYAIDLTTGKQTPVVTIAPQLSAGQLSINGPVLSADGRFYGYSIGYETSSLSQVSGLRP
ncbi:MAG: protein kinase domain-containing protein [Terriglobales bacterium]